MASTKTTHIQLRVSPDEKAIIQAGAERAGMDMSAWILSSLLLGPKKRWGQLLKSLANSQQSEQKKYVLADINDFLSGLDSLEIGDVLFAADIDGLNEFNANYLAAMVELACHRKKVKVPQWTAEIQPLSTPHFGTNLINLRLYLLRASLPPFRSRNIFVDSSIGDRI